MWAASVRCVCVCTLVCVRVVCDFFLCVCRVCVGGWVRSFCEALQPVTLAKERARRGLHL